MTVLAGNVSKTVLTDIFGQLQEKLAWLADRPYLPEGLPFRTLTIFKALLQVILQATWVRQCSRFASYAGCHWMLLCFVSDLVSRFSTASWTWSLAATYILRFVCAFASSRCLTMSSVAAPCGVAIVHYCCRRFQSKVPQHWRFMCSSPFAIQPSTLQLTHCTAARCLMGALFPGLLCHYSPR